jgi:hypothetical protein
VPESAWLVSFRNGNKGPPERHDAVGRLVVVSLCGTEGEGSEASATVRWLSRQGRKGRKEGRRKASDDFVSSFKIEKYSYELTTGTPMQRTVVVRHQLFFFEQIRRKKSSKRTFLRSRGEAHAADPVEQPPRPAATLHFNPARLSRKSHFDTQNAYGFTHLAVNLQLRIFITGKKF